MFRINKLGAFALAIFLTACGGSGGSSETANQSPSANAGIDQTVDENSLVTLNGSGSDPDGTIASFNWKQLSGTQVILSNATAASSSFTAPDIKPDEILSFELTVTDNSGATATDTVDVTVLNINQLPIADAGTDQTIDENLTVTLNGSGTDTDGTIESFSWKQLSGTSVSLSDAAIVNPSFTAPDIKPDEILSFELTVTDDSGDTAIDTVDISVTHINQLPQANAGDDQSVAENSIVTLNGSGSDIDGTIEAFSWEQLSGSSVTLSDSLISNPNFTAPDITTEEILSFRLTVTDDEGATNTDIVEITVEIDDFSTRNINGFIRSEQRVYNASGILESTYTYTFDSVNKVVTRTSSNNNDEVRTFYYNNKGELIRQVRIASGEPDIDGKYTSSSYEVLYTYSDDGLLLERTEDEKLDGDIDEIIEWEYDAEGLGLMQKRVITFNWTTDVSQFVIDYVWSNGRKTSAVTTDISVGFITEKTVTYSFEGDNVFPSSYNDDTDSNGSVDRSSRLTYDENNNLILQRYYDSTGALTRYIETDYQSTDGVLISNTTHIDMYFFY